MTYAPLLQVLPIEALAPPHGTGSSYPIECAWSTSFPGSPAVTRTCGSCTACCDGWLQIEVRGHKVRKGQPCPFSVAHQCAIYPERPHDPCREFVCGWLVASSPLPDWMRPDKADMIMLAANFFWHGLPVDVIVAAGPWPK